MRAFWNWLIRQELITYNPAATVKRLRQTEPERDALTEEQQLRLYEAANGNTRHRNSNQLLVALILSTGLRAATLSALEKSDFDFETGLIHISAERMKAGRNHEVPLRDDVAELVCGLPEGRIFQGYAKNAAGLSYRFNRLLRRAGISLRGLRLGRRSFATSLLRTGADLRIVQDLLGHRNISTTSRYLIKADTATVREAVGKLPRPKPLQEEAHV